jgi:oligoendopeptidase F
MTPSEAADQRLGQKLLAVPEWQPGPEHIQFVRTLRYSARLAGDDLVAASGQIAARAGEHEEIAAAVTTVLHGRELTGPEVDALLQDRDRATREEIWRAQAASWHEQRDRIGELALDLLARRRRVASAAGLPDVRTYAWHELNRLDYTPLDCLSLHAAIADYVVPLAVERHERRRAGLGVETLRPWDLRIDPFASAPLQPFDHADAFADGMAPVFRHRDPELGTLFDRMRAEGYLDVGWRQHKRRGGVERPFPLSRIPFVSVCGDGSEINVGTLVHEMGHAFHDHQTMQHHRFEWTLRHTDEFSELAALGMWWLVEPCLSQERGGFYTQDEARRNRARLLEQLLIHDIPHHARTDAFHHWFFAEAPPDVSAADMDAKWAELGARFEPWLDVSGLEMEEALGWRQGWALFSSPFYEVAYVLANLGALQLWASSERDPEGTWRRFTAALSLGNTLPMPDLYRAAGAELPFDAAVVRDVVRFARTRLKNP